MWLYAQVARRSFRRYSTYRGATAAGVFTNTVFAFIKAYVLLAVYQLKHHAGNLDAAQIVTYTFVAQGFLATVGAFGELEIGERIRTGDVVTDLYRPVDFQGWWLAQDVGRAGFQLLARGIPPVAIGALWFHLVLPRNPLIWLAFLGTAFFAVVLSFAVRFVTSLSGFWLLDTRGATQLVGAALMFGSGFLVPLNLFPTALGRAVRLFPFAGIVQVPIDIVLGKGSAGAVALQIAWIVALLAAGRFVLARAQRRLVIQGG